ncbi:MAG TPA: winged helix DNA-binding domain-containing protein, partial [Thermoanaerobaculia bacterium]|nr:winged helix DNA-binding domain-containing protein [Thermoanaerobaculia bacterium]
QLNRATLARQLLLERSRVSAVEAVGRLAGLQAQLARPPYIALWSRLADFARADLTRAAAGREVVRATAMRGTLHLLTKKDYVAFRPVLQEMLTKGAQSRLQDRPEIDVEPLVTEARAFFDERPRTFEELRKHLIALHPDADERAMGYLVRMHLPLVQVPDDSPWGWPANSDFAVAESWIGKKLPRTAKPEALAMSYFAAFGPASAADLQTWSGVASAREMVEKLRPKLRALRDPRGRELFDVPDAPRVDEDAPAPARFLPEFDSLLLAHADRTRVVADEWRPRIATKNLRILPTFLIDGFVAGTWEVERKKGVATLMFAPFGKLAKTAKRELAEEGERLLRFVEEDAKSYVVTSVA